jgi:L-arabinose isomerase
MVSTSTQKHISFIRDLQIPLSFDTVDGGLFRISIFSIGPIFFLICARIQSIRILRKALSLHLWKVQRDSQSSFWELYWYKADKM